VGELTGRESILLVEDSADDVAIIRRGFEKAGMANLLQVVRDGESAISYLRGDNKYSVREEYPLPTVVLLDLALSAMDGFGVLTWIRQSPAFHDLPVLILSWEGNVPNVQRAYLLGANSFIVKDGQFESKFDAAMILKGFWMGDAGNGSISCEI
jgi:CheY-like chemotaxis protein